jgi:FkbM family methyltransferase
MKIYYGTPECQIDVTDICYTELLHGDIIVIPPGDIIRARIFTDPVHGVVKKIFVQLKDDDNIVEYSHVLSIHINIVEHTITLDFIYSKLFQIHSQLKIIGGSFTDEIEEQKMSYKYLKGDEKVLEIGGNIGRNSMIIAYLLGENQNNLVVLESDENSANVLRQNRKLNNMNFHIENSALSKRKLIQRQWDTIPSDELLNGYKWVNTITLEELRAKYKIQFDTLVLDCEGAFYYILMDMPDIMDNIKLIIVENDYHDISHKEYIDTVLQQNNFNRTYVQSGGWHLPCSQFFYEVWERLK